VAFRPEEPTERRLERPLAANGERAHGAQSSRHRLAANRLDGSHVPAAVGRRKAKLPARWYFAGGLGIVGGADLLLAFAARDLNAPLAIWAVVGALLVGGAGCAVFNAQITATAVSAVPSDRAATASAICVTMRQIGFAFGIALIGALLQRNDPIAYTTAFAMVSACTLGLAALAFALLGRSD
jgi:predicted MFS family arabinose efflux permease